MILKIRSYLPRLRQSYAGRGRRVEFVTLCALHSSLRGLDWGLGTRAGDLPSDKSAAFNPLLGAMFSFPVVVRNATFPFMTQPDFQPTLVGPTVTVRPI